MAPMWWPKSAGRPDGRDKVRARRQVRRQEEETFLQEVLALARLCHWGAYHTRDSRRSDAGWPDLVLVKPPRLLIRELKREGEQPTDAQRDWLAALTACGLDCSVWRPSDWPQIERILQGDEHGD